MRKLVIIPTYNEKENISAMIDKVFSLPEPFEMLVIDDGSPDGTAAIVRERQKEFPERLHLMERAGKLGLGTAYLAGFRWGLENGFDYICEMDCDFSHNPDDLVRLYRAAAEGNDVVVGSRYVQGVNVVNWPMSRLLMSYFASMYVRIVTRMPLRDATAGFVCYSRRANFSDPETGRLEEMNYFCSRYENQTRTDRNPRFHCGLRDLPCLLYTSPSPRDRG